MNEKMEQVNVLERIMPYLVKHLARAYEGTLPHGVEVIPADDDGIPASDDGIILMMERGENGCGVSWRVHQRGTRSLLAAGFARRDTLVNWRPADVEEHEQGEQPVLAPLEHRFKALQGTVDDAVCRLENLEVDTLEEVAEICKRIEKLEADNAALAMIVAELKVKNERHDM